MKEVQEPFFTPNLAHPELLPKTVEEAEYYLNWIRGLYDKQGHATIKRDENGLLAFLPNAQFPEEMKRRLHEFGFRLPRGMK